MFLFWIFKTKNVSRMPCCLTNIICGVKPLVILFIFLQLLLLIIFILHLRGIIDFMTVWSTYSQPSSHLHRHLFALNFTTVYHLQDSEFPYITKHGKLFCFKEGTAEMKKTCKCHPDWHGSTCGIPSSIWFAKNYKELHLTLRQKPRRIIYAFPIGSSLDLLEIRLQELKNVADVFIIADDDVHRKQLRLPSFLSADSWLNDFYNRLIYIPYSSRKPVDIFRTQILHHMSDVRPDDIILFSESNEIPSSDVLSCLKLFNGFPDVMILHYRPLCNGFYNVIDQISNGSQSSIAPSLSSINFLLRKCYGDGSCLKSHKSNEILTLGSSEYPIGWKCNKCKPSFKHTRQINDSTALYKFAPAFVLEQNQRFAYLLNPPQPSFLHLASNASNLFNISKTNASLA